MFGDIETFSVTKFLDETYPTNDDTEAKQTVIDYMTQSLSKHKNVNSEEMDHFMDTFITRLRAISNMCKGLSNMDECPVDLVDDISKSIDSDLTFLLREKNEIIKISNGTYFLNLSTLPDAVKFYKFLYENNKIRNTTSRKNLEALYNECNLGSNYSNVLFSLSWLNVLRVYSTNLIYFNKQSQFYF